MKQDWLSTFPDFFPPLGARPSWNIPPLGHRAEEFASFQRDLAILLNFSEKNPEQTVSLARALALRGILLEWFQLPATQEALTVPFTEKGLVHAIAMTVENNPESDSVLLLAAMYPQASLQAFRLSQFPSTFSNATLPVSDQDVVVAPPPSRPSYKTDVVSDDGKEAKALRSKRKKGKASDQPSPPLPRHRAVVTNTDLLQRWLSDISSDAPLPLQRDAWTQKVKASVLAAKGTGGHAYDYWFTDILLPGLCGLDRESLERAVALCSDHMRPTLTPPSHHFKDFWLYLRGMPSPDRSYLINEALPHLIDASLWTFKDRITLLDIATEGTQNKSWAFGERLRFWQALGGSLDEPGSLGQQSDVFSATTLTARQHLEQRGFDLAGFPARSHPGMK